MRLRRTTGEGFPPLEFGEVAFSQGARGLAIGTTEGAPVVLGEGISPSEFQALSELVLDNGARISNLEAYSYTLVELLLTGWAVNTPYTFNLARPFARVTSTLIEAVILNSIAGYDSGDRIQLSSAGTTATHGIYTALNSLDSILKVMIKNAIVPSFISGANTALNNKQANIKITVFGEI